MQKAYLVGLQQQGHFDWEIEENLTELQELAEDAGIEVLGTFIQKRTKPEAATFIGAGKALEIGEILVRDEMVIFDDELTPAQQGNLSDIMDAPVIDRTQLILDIFASRAQSKEGKIQVELAQLNYMLPRLSGEGAALSRLGGGIGTRGPGESKLETDRRRIRKRISDLRAELEQVRHVRKTHRQNRERFDVPTVALVGYTNAGKSTLLAKLTGENTYIADQLFATLDPTIRRWDLDENRWVFLSDTVGFIRKLPTTLVAAFRATLEEVTEADLLIHVVDASSPMMEEQIQAVEEVLDDIGADQEIIYVFNKIDRLDTPPTNTYLRDEIVQPISAYTGQNLDRLQNLVNEYFGKQDTVREYFFDFTEVGQSTLLRDLGKIITEEFVPEGLRITAKVDPTLAQRMSKWEHSRK